MADHRRDEAGEALERLFRRKPVVELEALRSALGTTSRTTVFRALRRVGYLTSYSHAGRYYTLRKVPRFDGRGLWICGEVRFSVHGTLRATIVVLIKQAPAGHTHEELEVILGLRVHDTLRSLVEGKQVGRERIEAVYVYVDSDPERAAAQLERRRRPARTEPAGAAPTLPPPLDLARVVDVLLAVIHAPKDDARTIAARLRAGGLTVENGQVEAVFAQYGLGKKRRARAPDARRAEADGRRASSTPPRGPRDRNAPRVRRPGAGETLAKRLQERRFATSFADPADVKSFRKALLDLAGGFTEVTRGEEIRYIVGLRGREATKRLRTLLAAWGGRARAGPIELEDRSVAPDGDEIYFLLPILRNPDRREGIRRHLFTNEELRALRRRLAALFQFRPEIVRVYGEWRNSAGEPVADPSFLVRVPRRDRTTLTKLRRFIREQTLANPNSDQDCIYLSSRWQGELVYPA